MNVKYVKKKENLHLHHVTLFSEIIKESLSDLNLDEKDTDEYSKVELSLIVNVILGKHLNIDYLTLCDECHKKIHKEEKVKLCDNEKHNVYYANLRNKKVLEREIYVDKVLMPYLDAIVGKKLFKVEQHELIEMINVRVNRRLQKSYKKLNAELEMASFPFVIIKKIDKQRRLEDGSENPNRDKTYWKVIKIIS